MRNGQNYSVFIRFVNQITPHTFVTSERRRKVRSQTDKRKTPLAYEHKAPSFKGFHCLGGQIRYHSPLENNPRIGLQSDRKTVFIKVKFFTKNNLKVCSRTTQNGSKP